MRRRNCSARSGFSVSNWSRDPQGVSIGGFGLAACCPATWRSLAICICATVSEDKSVAFAGLDRQGQPRHRQHEHAEVAGPAVLQSVPGRFPKSTSTWRWIPLPTHHGIPPARHRRRDDSQGLLPARQTDGLIAGAVKSEVALPADSAGADLLANKIREISTEKATEVGVTSEIAAAISGRIFRFPGNPLGVKSLSLSLADPSPRYDLEIYTRDRSQPPLKLNCPIGFDWPVSQERADRRREYLPPRAGG